MAILTRVRRGRRRGGPEAQSEREAPVPTTAGPAAPELDIAPDDPVLAHLQSAPGPVDVESLEMDSPALREMRAQGLKLVVPLVAQGELIGLLNLGPRLSEQEYSGDDMRLLENLAAQAAPAVRVAQLVREQQAEARRRERIEHELQVAQLIQKNFLPRETPALPGWEVAAFYRPARTVGGDFYDFIKLDGGRIGIVIGDVTDKGVPAALVMAATRSVLRAAAGRLEAPAAVLGWANDLLTPDIPENMFVTCMYGVLDPATGVFRLANAGHDVPYVRRADGRVEEFRATGMPLGMLEDMTYDEAEGTIEPGDTVLLTSDGLIEAHDPQREMFGFPRVRERMSAHPGGVALMDRILEDLAKFTGPDWEQEDDVTLVAISRSGVASGEPDQASTPAVLAPALDAEDDSTMTSDGSAGGAQDVVRFSLPSGPGGERAAAERVAELVRDSWLSEKQAERLKTAVAEASMNAMEHGNEYRADLPVDVEVGMWPDRLVVRITDAGGRREADPAEEPSLEAKLEGKQTPRGWGLFLIRHMVDEMNVTTDEEHHTVELVLRRKETEG